MATRNGRGCPVDNLRDNLEWTPFLHTPADETSARRLYRQYVDDLKVNDPAAYDELPTAIREWTSGTRPDGYTWNHDFEMGSMTLVPSSIHNTTAGGFSHLGGNRGNFGQVLARRNLSYLTGNSMSSDQAVRGITGALRNRSGVEFVEAFGAAWPDGGVVRVVWDAADEPGFVRVIQTSDPYFVGGVEVERFSVG